jgi:hypothetical protein
MVSCISRDNPFDPINQHAAYVGTVTVSDKDTLTNRLLNAAAGDTIIIERGVYPVSLRFNNNGTAAGPIMVMGKDTGTVLNALPPDLGIMFLSAKSFIQFKNIVFEKSFGSGAKIENGSHDISFSHCVFRGNAFDGLEITDSDVLATDCVFEGNQKAGVRINGNGTASHAVVMDNVLAAHNTQDGVAIIAAPVSISHSTISDNGGNAISLATPAGRVSVASSVLSFNGGAGISGVWNQAAAQLAFDSLDIFQSQPDTSLNPVVSFSYWSFDPLFADHTAGNYTPTAQSEIYKMETQGIIIGYRRR